MFSKFKGPKTHFSLGGPGGMPPRKFLNSGRSETLFPVIWGKILTCNHLIFLKWRFDHRSYNRNLSNCKFKPEKKFLGFNGIWTHGLCVSTAVLYQLSYEDPYIGSRPIYWVHLNPWQEFLSWVKMNSIYKRKRKFHVKTLLHIIILKVKVSTTEWLSSEKFKSVTAAATSASTCYCCFLPGPNCRDLVLWKYCWSYKWYNDTK